MIRIVAALFGLLLSTSAFAAGVGPPVNSALGCTNSGDTYQWNGSAMVCTSAGSGSSTIPVTTIATSGTSQALAFPSSGSNAYDITLTANCTLTLTGGTTGQYQTTTWIIRAGTGGFSTTLPSGIKWPAGVAPTVSSTAGQVTVLTVSTPDGGTTLLGNY